MPYCRLVVGSFSDIFNQFETLTVSHKPGKRKVGEEKPVDVKMIKFSKIFQRNFNKISQKLWGVG